MKQFIIELLYRQRKNNFSLAMEILMFNCYKDYEEIIYENGFPEKN